MVKVRFNAADLAEALRSIVDLCKRKTNLVITSTVLIRADSSSGCRVHGTDLETSVETELLGQVETDGVACIDGARLNSIAQAWPSADLIVEEEDKRWFKIHDGSGNVCFHVVGMDPDDYPERPDVGGSEFVQQMKGADFRAAAAAALVVAGDMSDKRAHVAGVRFASTGRVAQMTSTDGNRMVLARWDYENPFGPILVPKKGLMVLRKAAGDQVEFRHGENHLTARSGPRSVSIRLLEGDYPQFESLFEPVADAVSIHFDAGKLLGVLKRMQILSSDAYKGVILAFAGDRCTITASNPEVGESKESIGFGGGLPEPFEVAFNPAFVADAVETAGTESVSFYFQRGKYQQSGCRIGDGWCQSVVMPMKM